MSEGPSLRITYADGRAPVALQFPIEADPFLILEKVFTQFPSSAPVAQLEERSLRKAEVVGSIPAGGSKPGGVRDTSMAAYRKAQASGKLTAQQHKVFTLFLQNSERTFTRSEAAEALKMRINALTGRINELITPPFDVLEECGKRRCRVTGETVNELRVKR